MPTLKTNTLLSDQKKYNVTKRSITKKGTQRDEGHHWSYYSIVTLHKNDKNITKDEFTKIRKLFGIGILLIPNDLLRIILGYVNFPQQKMIYLNNTKISNIGAKHKKSRPFGLLRRPTHSILFTDNVVVCTVLKTFVNGPNEEIVGIPERLEYTEFNRTMRFEVDIDACTNTNPAINKYTYQKCSDVLMMNDYLKNEKTEEGACNGNHRSDWSCNELLEDLINIKKGSKKYAKSWFVKKYEIFTMSNNSSQTINTVKKYLEQTNKKIDEVFFVIILWH